MQVNLILIVITILGLIVKNDSLIISGIVLLTVRNLKLEGIMDLIDNYSVKVGIILIMLGVLAPLATGEMKLDRLTQGLLDPLSILAIVMGIAVTQFTREGISLLESDPAITVNLVLGVIFGVTFFNGLPSGPLIASGITAVLYKLFSFFS
ncbi:putative membrane protein [Halobacteroides halobius DSM 5150]|uniref:UPF0756 membrane protein Halha_2494 n=1 Tax=Halobacteroides halobius (strain ATCC 35273 / DSM 5150 / MD-1) TaxID=748449 RepID=L0KE75_HALHC|nr:DUF441 domain-containing protein [Halobacteroides halobius]AGB42368.1 putative membrane protein [Halobacteroides halobius DSM 5150]